MELSTTRESLVVWTLDSFPAFYGTRRFNTQFTRALHLSLSWVRPIQSTSPHPYKVHPNIIQLPMSWSSLWAPSLRLSHQQPIRVLLLPHSCYMPRPSHLPRLNYSNNAWRRVQVMINYVMLKKFKPKANYQNISARASSAIWNPTESPTPLANYDFILLPLGITIYGS
jgi:hypothetical protein